jgi:hypothetical protein
MENREYTIEHEEMDLTGSMAFCKGPDGAVTTLGKVVSFKDDGETITIVAEVAKLTVE